MKSSLGSCPGYVQVSRVVLHVAVSSIVSLTFLLFSAVNILGEVHYRAQRVRLTQRHALALDEGLMQCR